MATEGRRLIADLRNAAEVRRSTWLVAATALLLAALLELQERLVFAAALAQRASSEFTSGHAVLGPAFLEALPYPVVDPAFAPPTSIHLALIALGAFEAGLLFVLYRLLRGRIATLGERIAIALAAAAMAAIALQAPGMTSFDAYAYVGYVKLPHFADVYAPPALRLPGAFGAVNDVWGTPLVPCYYGPLWVALSRSAAGSAASLGSTIVALRLIEVVAFGWIAVVLAARRDVVALVLFALNPAVYAMYVVNAHNDLLAAAFMLSAVVIVRRFPALAAAGIAAAASIKIPLLIAALFVFRGRGGWQARAAWAALAVVLALGLSVLFGGRAYAADLLGRLHQLNGATNYWYILTGRVTKFGLLAITAVALVGAFVRGVMWRSAGWSFIAVGSQVYPWYLIWALPYAALERRALVAFLIPLPFVAAVMEPSFTHLGLGQLAMLAMLIVAAYEIVRRKQIAIPS